MTKRGFKYQDGIDRIGHAAGWRNMHSMLSIIPGLILPTQMSNPLYFVAFYAKVAGVRRLHMFSDYSQTETLHLRYQSSKFGFKRRPYLTCPWAKMI